MLKRKIANKNQSSRFNPDRKYLETAVGEYIRNGGKIKHLVVTPDTEICVLPVNYADAFFLRS